MRYPLAPLLAALGIVVGSPRWASRAATRIGVHQRQIHRWMACGIAWPQADHIAIHLDMHPANLWDDWFDDHSDQYQEVPA